MLRIRRLMVQLVALLGAALLFSSTLVWLGAGSAAACSCEAVTKRSIDLSDGAFVGVVQEVHRRDVDVIVEIDVERDLMDNLADRIYVNTFDGGENSCGLRPEVGATVASFVRSRGTGPLDMSLCSQLPDDVLADWQPAVGVGGDASAFSVTGGRGDATAIRLLAHGTDGSPIAFGLGAGRIEHLGLCDGDSALVEVIDTAVGSDQVEIRDLATFEIIESIELRGLEVEEIECSVTPLRLRVSAIEFGRLEATTLTWEDGLFARIEDPAPVPVRTRSELNPDAVSANELAGSVYELPVVVPVPATGPVLSAPIGDGFLPEATASATRLVVIAGAIALACIAAAFALRRRA